MFDSVGGFFSDAINTATSIWNAEQNRAQQGDTASANRYQAAQNQAWQEEMSNTAYQRAVKDLTAAGLSPMLAYSKGSASTPSGNVGISSTPGSPIESPQIGQSSLRSAQAEAAREQAQVAKSTVIVNAASADKLKAEADNVRQDTENKRLYPGMNTAQINELMARAGQHGASSAQLQAMIDEIRQTIALRKPEETFKEENPNVAKWMHPIQEGLRTIFEGAGLLRGTSALPNVVKMQGGRR